MKHIHNHVYREAFTILPPRLYSDKQQRKSMEKNDSLLRNYFVFIFISVTLLFASSLQLAAADTKGELRLGVFPRRNFVQTAEMFSPLCAYLSDELKIKVTLISTRDFKSFWNGVTQKDYDIVHYNQYHYVTSHDKQGYQVILKNEEFGEAVIAGAIITRSDREINDIDQLRGKKIIFGGGRMAMQSYVIATYLLQSGGLSPNDYAYDFALNPPNAIMAVYYGHADAAGAGDRALNLPLLKKKIDISKLKYLRVGPPLAHLPWAVRADMHAEQRMKIQTILKSLKNSSKGRMVLNKARLSNLLIATDDEYDPHRKMIAKVLENNSENGQ
jgi:phosphonate transport system substrate-binding protein